MSKRKRIFFSYFILFLFTSQLGLICSVPFFENKEVTKQLSSLTKDSEDDDDSDTEESEIELYQAMHSILNIASYQTNDFTELLKTNFFSYNELVQNQADFKVPFSPPELA